MTQKHIGFSDSIVMKELAKIAVKEKLIEFEDRTPEIEVKASTELKETGDTFIDAITLARSLREHGFNKQAALLERRALELKAERNSNDPDEDKKYNWWDETGDSLLDSAHQCDTNAPLPSSNEYGVIEGEGAAQRKILETLKHQPTGKLSSASKKKIIDEINVIAQGMPHPRDPDQTVGQSEGDPNWETMKVSVNEVVKSGSDAAKQAKTIPTGRIPIGKLEGDVRDTFLKVTRLPSEKLDKSIELSKNPAIIEIISGGNPRVYTLGRLDKEVANKITNKELREVANTITPLKNYTPMKRACELLGLECNLAPKISAVKSAILGMSITGSESENIGAKTAIEKLKKDLLADYSRIYAAIRTEYPKEIENVNNALNGGALLAFREPIWGAADSLYNILASLPTKLQNQLRFKPTDFDKNLNTSEMSLDKLIKVLLSSKLLYSVSDKAAEFNAIFEAVNKNVEVSKGSINQTRTSLYEYKAFDKNLRLSPASVKVDIPGMAGRIEAMIDGWKQIDSQAAGMPEKLTENIINKIEKEKELGFGILQAFQSALNAQPYAHFYRSLPKGVSVPKDPRALDGAVSTWENELTTSQAYMNQLEKGASKKNDLSKFGFGGGLGGAATPKPGTSGTRGTGGGTGKKVQDGKVKSLIGAMQKMQGDFAAHAASEAVRTNADPDIASAIDTAKEGLRGANSDGVWGANTQSSLETIQRYIDANPGLKTKIQGKLHSAKPAAGESDSGVNKNTKTNIRIIAHASALLGDPKYSKYLPDLMRAAGFDMIPKVYTVPEDGNKDTFMPDESGIKISRRELSSLGYLKGYLVNSGYSATGVGDIQ